jgi:hypothetical protein
MKARKPTKYQPHKNSAAELKESAVADVVRGGPMVRTQIYLNQNEYDFVQAEAKRRNEPMAAVIREFIDEKMEIPEDAWTNNPMLRTTPHDPDWESPPDAAINHDHYLYGGPKSWVKQNGKWVEAPPLPEDYFDNPASAKAYDAMIAKMEREEKRKARG